MFKDKYLQLVLIDESVSLGEKYHFGWGKFSEFCQINFGKEVELGYEINTEIEHFFLNLEIPERDLLEIENLCLDGDHATYFYLTTDLEAQLDHIAIHSLEGIENCKNIRKLILGPIVKRVDLQPLTHLHKLEELSIDFYSTTHYEALLSIPTLKKLEIGNWHLFPAEDQQILASVLSQLETQCHLVVSANWKNSIS